jgi:hypothetical protein
MSLASQVAAGFTAVANKFNDIKPLAATAASLASTNPVVAAGRLARTTDTGVFAMGDGTTAWNSLPKFYPSSAPVILTVTTAQSGIGGSPTDLTGLSGCAFTVGAVPWEIVLSLAWLDMTASYGSVLAYISTSAGVALNAVAQVVDVAGNGSVIVRHQISTPGSYNLKGQLQVLSGGGTVSAGASVATLINSLTARPMA